jgi:hypothetical protein
MFAAAARCGAARSVASLAAAGTCYSEKLMSVRIFGDRVKDIRRATRRQQKRRTASSWRACAARRASPSCAVVKRLSRICISAGSRAPSRLRPSSGVKPFPSPCPRTGLSGRWHGKTNTPVRASASFSRITTGQRAAPDRNGDFAIGRFIRSPTDLWASSNLKRLRFQGCGAAPARAFDRVLDKTDPVTTLAAAR